MYEWQIITVFSHWSVDNKAGDILAAKLMTRGESSVRMTRMCLCPYEFSDQSNHECIPINASILERLSQAALGCTYGVYVDG